MYYLIGNQLRAKRSQKSGHFFWSDPDLKLEKKLFPSEIKPKNINRREHFHDYCLNGGVLRRTKQKYGFS